jgi:stage VI sporulation protein D
MSERARGLRFDLFERVSVPDSLPAIFELDELELLPHIQCAEEQEMVVMRGHFAFAADYYSAPGEAQTERLEHRIPVDITLPRQRIERLDEVRVDIENYDVAKVSERELHLNVVVELRGLTHDEEAELETSARRRRKAQREAGQRRAAEQQEWEQALPPQEGQEEAVRSDEPVSADPEPSQSADDEFDEWWREISQQTEQVENSESGDELERAETQSVHHEPEETSFEPPPAISVPDSVPVAAPVAPAVSVPSVAPAPPVAPMPPVQSMSPEPPPAVNVPDWSRQLFRERSGSPPAGGARLRLYIVQSHDTLEAIAARYALQAQELILYNRLSDRNLQPGQMLQIPAQPAKS